MLPLCKRKIWPLCTLYIAANVLEKLVEPRLLAAIRSAERFLPRQYSIRWELLTVDAIFGGEVVRRAENYSHFLKSGVTCSRH